MRTTLEIDERLLHGVMMYTGQKSKTKAVNEALAAYMKDQGIRKLFDLQGKMDLDLDDWYEFRHEEDG